MIKQTLWIVLFLIFLLLFGCNRQIKKNSPIEQMSNYKSFHIIDKTSAAIRYTTETDYVIEVITAVLESKGYKKTDSKDVDALTLEINIIQFNALESAKKSFWTGGVTTVKNTRLIFDVIFKDKANIYYHRRMGITRGTSKKEIVGIAVDATLKPVPNCAIR